MQGPDYAACRMDKGSIVGIIGFGNNDLRIGVQDGQVGQKQGLAAATGDENILRLQIHPQLLVVALNGLNQAGHSGRSCIGKSRMIHLLHRVKECLGCNQIRLTDIQVIDFLSLLFRLDRQGMKFPHRGRFAAICVDGYFHKYLPWQHSCPVKIEMYQ